MGEFLLVITLTTGGFHVKHHCLISEYVPLSVLPFIAIAVYSVSRKWLRHALKRALLALLQIMKPVI